jgi:hypothetical protein
MSHRPLDDRRLLISTEAVQAQFAQKITAQLTRHTDDLPSDISERLRFGRENAIQHARAVRLRQVASPGYAKFGSVLTWFGSNGDESSGWWMKCISILPLFVLLAGLVAIQDWHNNSEIAAVAEVDSSLLADDLPPAAYGDVGFLEFLKSHRE